MDSRVCKRCGNEKDVSFFRKNRGKCKKCENDLRLEYYLSNPDKVKEVARKSYNKNKEKNKEKINKRNRLKYKENPEKIKAEVKKYRDENPDKVKASARKYYDKNVEKITAYHKEYRAKNKEKRRQQRIEYEKRKRAEDINFNLRKIVSNAIYCALSRNSSSKKGGSILDNLPYPIDQLRIHLEDRFKEWMTWENWGIYDPKTWDENDKSTWTWQIDHIIRQADLPYTSMQDENFKKCWALENLRPYPAKTNIKECFRRLT